MFTAIFTLALVVAHVAAKIPPYINVCSRRDSNLDGCILENVNNLKSKICEGMPELSVPPAELMHMDQLDIINTDTAKISLNDLYTTGLCDYDIKSLHMDLEKRHFDVDIVFRRININMTYDFNVKIMVPVAMKGPIRVTTDNVLAKAGVDLNMATKGNKQYVYLSNMKLDLDIKSYDVDISSFNDAEVAQMREIGQHLLGRNQQELLAVLKPKLEEVISKQILNFSNKIVKHFTYDELFPDRI